MYCATAADGRCRQLSVDVANHTDALVAIIWFYETGRDPLVYRWQRDADKGAPLTAVWRIEEPG